MSAKKNISTLHEFIMSMAQHTGFSLGSIGDKKDAVAFKAITGMTGETVTGPNEIIPAMVSNFDSLEALRAAMFGTGPGNPRVQEIFDIVNDSGDDFVKNCFRILPHDDEGPDPSFGDTTLGNADTTWSAGHLGLLAMSDEVGSVATEEHEGEVAALPKVYNICTTDISLSREVGNAEAIHLFMNTVPTIEFSRCVPYLDVQFYGPVRGGDVDADGVPSLYRFILGKDGFKNSPWAKTSNRLEMPDASEDTSEDAEKAVVRNISGMEVFLSPQTLVNADERTTATRLGGFHGLTNGVVDPFRPFMSLTGLKLNIAPQVNSIIFSEGTLTFTLHDKSRLPEISSLVSPKNMGQVYLTITYGWSHPDGEGTTDITVGKFLDSLKTTETFIISNSSYTFTPTGEVNVTLNIAASGAQQMVEGGKILDDVALSDTRAITQLEELIVLIRNSLPDRVNGIPTTRVKKNFESAGKGAGLFTSALGKAKLRQLINVARSSGVDIDDAITKLEEIVGPTGENIPTIASQRTNVAGTWYRKMVGTIRRPDPFLSWKSGWKGSAPPDQFERYDELKSDTSSEKYMKRSWGNTPQQLSRGRGYCSIGKLFNAYVIAPLLSSPNCPDYDEVQVYWGVLNDRASYLKNMNIAAVPVKTADFLDRMTKVKDAQGPNIGIMDFVGLIQNAFFDNHAWEGYGFGSAGSGYGRGTPNKDTGLLDYKAKETENAVSNAAKKREKVLKKAYTTGPFEFKQPLIKVVFEAPPVEPLIPAGSESGLGALKQTKILKIFIEDEKSMSYSGATDLMQRVFEDYVPAAVSTAPEIDHELSAEVSRKINNNRAITFAEEMGLMARQGDRLVFAGGQAYKSILKSFAPSVEIGSSNSAIFAASVQNMGGTGNLRDVHMLKGADTSPESVEEEIMPMTMMPQQMTLTLPGMPLLAPLLTMFVDMKTGTDIDALYSIQSVSHDVAAGKFATTANLFYTGGYAVFKDLTQRLGDVASQMAEEHGEEAIQVINEEQVAASEENLEDLTEEERVRIQSFQESYNRIGADADLVTQYAADQAKAKEAAEVAAAKAARLQRLRKLKPDETIRKISTASSRVSAKRRRLETLRSDRSKETVQKVIDKNMAIAEDLDSLMRTWLNSSFSDDVTDTLKFTYELKLDTQKSLRGG